MCAGAGPTRDGHKCPQVEDGASRPFVARKEDNYVSQKEGFTATKAHVPRLSTVGALVALKYLIISLISFSAREAESRTLHPAATARKEKAIARPHRSFRCRRLRLSSCRTAQMHPRMLRTPKPDSRASDQGKSTRQQDGRVVRVGLRAIIE